MFILSLLEVAAAAAVILPIFKSNFTVSRTSIAHTLVRFVVECRICNREVAGSNLSLGYFAPRSTQPSILPGSVNEYQLRPGRQRQVWLIPIADERVGVHCAGKTEIPREHVPYLSASAVVIHYEEAPYQM